jgi:beta-glucanase (GH16 family)
MQLSGVYSELSDGDLDASYAASYASMQAAPGQAKVTWSSVVSAQGQEIIDRLSGVWGFTSGIFGRVRFPKYDVIQKSGGGGFQQSAVAQTAVTDSASNVGKTLSDAVGKIGFAGLGIGVAAIALLILIKKK